MKTKKEIECRIKELQILRSNEKMFSTEDKYYRDVQNVLSWVLEKEGYNGF